MSTESNGESMCLEIWSVHGKFLNRTSFKIFTKLKSLNHDVYALTRLVSLIIEK